MTDRAAPTNFIRQAIDEDLRNGKNDGRVVTRFPPEPNGYLHIGHAKAICLNFGVAEDYAGHCSLRFDDTNPVKESLEYVESIKADIHWLGYDWGEHLHHASDYFEQLYEWAVDLVRDGKAFVDSASAEEIRTFRGTLTEPGRESPHRNRSVEENLDLLTRMRAGEFPDGAQVLRAKIDMASPNMNLRDPVLYRILHASHQMTGDAWCIYPMYDFTQGQSDAIEHVTHSLCSLEFEDHRPLYDWFIENLNVPSRPRQIEFSRLNLSYTVMSKRRLKLLVDEGHVSGWDDPRMPTLVAMRRRGYTPAAIRDLCDRVGVTKKDNVIDVALLENCVREDLDAKAVRVMGVLRPLRVVIVNYPESEVDQLDAANHPQNPDRGTRKIPFSRVVFIEREDFMEDPPKKFFRLAPGREVRLRYAYLVTCVDVIKDDNGEVIEVHCRYDPDSRGGAAPDGRKVKGTIHWVSAEHALSARVRLYDRLFSVPDPDAGNFLEHINGESLELLDGACVEPSLGDAAPGTHLQFERLGYFCVDSVDSRPGAPVFNRTVTLRDSWAKSGRGSR
ncbi:MAG: glutamine--tRNA ligase/YqeY domain fusion protein [Gammaproteobacteria bacterium]|jgi:glutaminyl-tRNA synthetase|nr:glutamine--tRNA ligase/YqeY domain fusion protein [Gammaproteobacteria bacterium]